MQCVGLQSTSAPRPALIFGGEGNAPVTLAQTSFHRSSQVGVQHMRVGYLGALMDWMEVCNISAIKCKYKDRL